MRLALPHYGAWAVRVCGVGAIAHGASRLAFHQMRGHNYLLCLRHALKQIETSENLSPENYFFRVI